MYLWYGRLDIDALWFKLEASMPFELGSTAIDRSCLTWWPWQHQDTLYSFLNHPLCSYKLMHLSILFLSSWYWLLEPLRFSFRLAKSSPSLNTFPYLSQLLTTFSLTFLFSQTCLLLFLCLIYHLYNLPGLSILNYTQQLIGPSEFLWTVTNESTFGIIYKMGQALTLNCCQPPGP